MAIIEHGVEIDDITGDSLTLSNHTQEDGVINLSGDLQQNIQLPANGPAKIIALLGNTVTMHNPGKADITYVVA